MRYSVSIDSRFVARRREPAFFVVVEYRVDHVLRLVDELHEVDVAGRNHVLGDETVAQPVDQPAPERVCTRMIGICRDLARLHEGQRLQEFVERAEAAGQHDVGGGEPHERDFAREEMAESTG